MGLGTRSTFSPHFQGTAVSTGPVCGGSTISLSYIILYMIFYTFKVRVTAATVLSFSNQEDTSEIKKVLSEGLSSLDTQERWLSCQALACMLQPDAKVLKELSLHAVSDSSVERSRALTLLGRLSPYSVVVHAIAGTLVIGVHWKQKVLTLQF